MGIRNQELVNQRDYLHNEFTTPDENPMFFLGISTLFMQAILNLVKHL